MTSLTSKVIFTLIVISYLEIGYLNVTFFQMVVYILDSITFDMMARI